MLWFLKPGSCVVRVWVRPVCTDIPEPEASAGAGPRLRGCFHGNQKIENRMALPAQQLDHWGGGWVLVEGEAGAPDLGCLECGPIKSLPNHANKTLPCKY